VALSGSWVGAALSEAIEYDQFEYVRVTGSAFRRKPRGRYIATDGSNSEDWRLGGGGTRIAAADLGKTSGRSKMLIGFG